MQNIVTGRTVPTSTVEKLEFHVEKNKSYHVIIYVPIFLQHSDTSQMNLLSVSPPNVQAKISNNHKSLQMRLFLLSPSIQAVVLHLKKVQYAR